MRLLLALILSGACFAGVDGPGSVIVRRNQKHLKAQNVTLSIVLPGMGRLSEDRSNGSLVVVSVFVVADVLAWASFFYNRSQGDKFERRFQKYANNHWSVDRYAEFLEASLELSSGYLGRGGDVDRSRLIEAENQWASLSGVSVHHLYESGRQQYYEMIYKYPEQFALGWDDAVSNPVSFPQTGYTRSTPTEMMLHYRSIRNRSNDRYASARGMIGFLLANRLLSTFDAVVFLGKRHKPMSLQWRIEPTMDSFGSHTITPMLRMTF